MKCRRGVTLLEMIASIVVMSVLMGVAAVLLQSLLKVDRRYRQQRVENAAVDRLAQQWRADCHAAEKVAIGKTSDDLQTVVFNLADSQVRYTLAAGQICRTVQQDNRVAAREYYSVRGTATAEVTEAGTARLAVLNLMRRRETHSDNAPLPFRLEGHLQLAEQGGQP